MCRLAQTLGLTAASLRPSQFLESEYYGIAFNNRDSLDTLTDSWNTRDCMVHQHEGVGWLFK